MIVGPRLWRGGNLNRRARGEDKARYVHRITTTNTTTTSCVQNSVRRQRTDVFGMEYSDAFWRVFLHVVIGSPSRHPLLHSHWIGRLFRFRGNETKTRPIPPRGNPRRTLVLTTNSRALVNRLTHRRQLQRRKLPPRQNLITPKPPPLIFDIN